MQEINISKLRKEKNLRAIDMAEKLGISQGHYSNLEKGRRPFNELLIRKTARIFGVSEEVIRKASVQKLSDSHKLKSWISNIRINGLPLIRAYKYYVEINNLEDKIIDDSFLKKSLKSFIESNIGYSVIAELTENRELIKNVRESINSLVLEENKNKKNKSNK